jgi:hypothetical protein
LYFEILIVYPELYITYLNTESTPIQIINSKQKIGNLL